METPAPGVCAASRPVHPAPVASRAPPGCCRSSRSPLPRGALRSGPILRARRALVAATARPPQEGKSWVKFGSIDQRKPAHPAIAGNTGPSADRIGLPPRWKTKGAKDACGRKALVLLPGRLDDLFQLRQCAVGKRPCFAILRGAGLKAAQRAPSGMARRPPRDRPPLVVPAPCVAPVGHPGGPRTGTRRSPFRVNGAELPRSRLRPWPCPPGPSRSRARPARSATRVAPATVWRVPSLFFSVNRRQPATPFG